LRGAKTAIDEGLQNVALLEHKLINHILPKMKWMKSGLPFQILKLNTNVPSIE
jgi:hypothetical protein